MRVNASYAVLGFALTVSGCAALSTGSEDDLDKVQKPGVAMIYMEKEEGLEANAISYFINADFIRIDDKVAPNDFILFDRKSRYIYNVIGADKTIAIITPRPVLIKPPIPISYTEEKQESGAVQSAPGLNKGYHYKFSANDVVCYNVVVAENYLSDVVSAFSEFRTVLAGEHAAALSNSSVEQWDPCDLALNIFDPLRHLQHGFPIREWNSKGYSKFLSFVQVGTTIDKSFLELPPSYTRHAFGTKPH